MFQIPQPEIKKNSTTKLSNLLVICSWQFSARAGHVPCKKLILHQTCMVGHMPRHGVASFLMVMKGHFEPHPTVFAGSITFKFPEAAEEEK